MTDKTMLGDHIVAKYELIRLHKWDEVCTKRGRQLGKAPMFGWRECQPLSDVQARDHMDSGRNVGVRLRATDLVVDVDPKNFEDGDDPWRRLCADLDIDASLYPTVITGSGGRHVYMTKPADLAVIDSHPDYQGVEFKSLGRQVVAPGSKHPNGKLYEWYFLSVSLSDVKKAPGNLLRVIQRARNFEHDEVTGGGNITPEQLEKMLEHLNVEAFRDQDRWLRMMMSCHHATGGEGRQEFISWCIGDPEYSASAGDIGMRWDSLSRSKPGGITYKTLFKLMSEAGHADKIPQIVEEFPDDLSPESIYKMVRPDGREIISPIDEMNRDYAVVLDGSDLFIFAMTNTDGGIDSRSQRGMRRMRRYAFEGLLENKKIEDENGKVKPLSKVWMGHPKRRTYRGVIFRPGVEVQKGVLNLWTGFAVVPRKGSWSLLDELIHDAICDGDDVAHKYMLDWVARMFQVPDKPAGTAIAMCGDKGVGKGTLGNVLLSITGRHGITASSDLHITGRFNSHFQDKIFLFADEAVKPYDKKAESVLKAMITEPTMMYEGKGRDVVHGPNCLHILMASNDEAVVPASLKGERRYAVVNSNDSWKADLEKFSRLRDQLYKHNGLEAFLWDMLDRDISDFEPQRVPQNSALAQQKLGTLSKVEGWWLHVLQTGKIDICLAYDDIHWDSWLERPIELRTVDVRNAFADFSKLEMRGSTPSKRDNAVAFGKALHRIAGGLEKYDKRDARGVKTKYYSLPPLGQLRRYFEGVLGGEIEWDFEA